MFFDYFAMKINSTEKNRNKHVLKHEIIIDSPPGEYYGGVFMELVRLYFTAPFYNDLFIFYVSDPPAVKELKKIIRSTVDEQVNKVMKKLW